MENKKNKFGLGIFIGILVTIVIGLSGFIIYDKVLSNNNEVKNEDKDKNETNNKITREEISSTDLDSILAKIHIYDANFSNSYPIQNFDTFSNAITNQDKLYFILSHSGFDDSFNKDSLKGVALRYFNDSFSYVDENISCFLGHSFYEYNATSGVYRLDNNHPGHGGSSSYVVHSYVVDSFYNLESKEYIINTKNLYGGLCDDACGPTFKFYDSSDLKNLIFDNSSEEFTYDEIYRKVQNKLPITTYTFVENSNNELVLSSVTIK